MDNAEKDLIVNLPENTQALLDNGLIDTDLINMRDEVQQFDPEKLDRYNDGLLYRIYQGALKSKTGTFASIAYNVGISKKLLQYYSDKYPKVALAIQIGIQDGRERMKESVVGALYEAAVGKNVVDTSTRVEKEYDSEGGLLSEKETVVTTGRYLSPNVTAAMELMKRLDPAWTPTINIDVGGTVTHTGHVVQDMNVQVDYRKLSTAALKELLASTKEGTNSELAKNELGESINSLRYKKNDEAREDGTLRPSYKPPAYTAARAVEQAQKAENRLKQACQSENEKLLAENPQTKIEEKRKRGRPKKSS